ncbi:phage N-6-adenine-methyltransferase [Xenorhabdus bharatensis]|uniref:phage N-6-adenine-methyltransferase n=1 Tax=Xenorhabdus bharatensis TaxID=3136256 RepID=UPI0030F3E2ED
MADFGGSNTPPEFKDLWQTPLPLFKALNLEFKFTLDVAASAQNALCTHYLTERENALDSDWVSHGAIWCNPPYSHIRPWIEKAAIESQKQLQPVVMLVPSDTSVGWFKLALETVDEVRLITGGRVQFIPVEQRKRNSNTKGSMFLIWRPFITPRKLITTVDKEHLFNIGNNEIRKIT